ncbi:MAG TPA: hypothetical protein PK358_05555 [Spirochaetota bacterium]|nr:hypothetical protein [Spirochaetota bacterium]HPJ34280.1 hypothetical protein [Spirochaetota bacterium]
MTHEDEGHYAAKRDGIQLNEIIAANIKERTTDNKISCADAHAIAVKLNITPEEVGAAIDLLEVKLSKCQLGLFGHGKNKNFPEMSGPVNPEIESAIKSLVSNGRITCAEAWKTAKTFKVSKATISAACEIMKIKISKCQLGTFR